MALWTASLLAGPCAFAKDSGTETSPDVTEASGVHEIEDMLQLVEHQISEGHTITPEDDNALITWSHMLESPVLKSAGARKALQAFAEQTRHSAETKQTAGDAVGASDFSVFSDQAFKLLDRPVVDPSVANLSSGDAADTSNAGPSASAAPDASTADGGVPREAPDPQGTAEPQHKMEPVAAPVDVAHAAPAPVDVAHAAPAPVDVAHDDPGAAVSVAPVPDPSAEHGEQPVAPSESTATTPAAVDVPHGEANGAPASDTGADHASEPVAPRESTAMPSMTPAPVEVARGDAGAAVSADTGAHGEAESVAPPGSTAMPSMAPAPVQVAHGGAGEAASAASVAEPRGEREAKLVAPDAAAVMPSMAPVPKVKEQTVSDQAADTYVRRGDAMIAIKDISAARKYYQYAANAGNARAAMALGETYDPAFLSRLRTVGLKADATMAAGWYRKAAALGDRAADDRLQALAMGAAK